MPPIHPRTWPVWLGHGCMWLLARLPHRWLMGLGNGLAPLLRGLMGRRFKVARRNIELCFPELDEAGREALLKGHSRALGRMLTEIVTAWYMPLARLDRLARFEGAEHLHAAQAAGRGVLLLAGHFSTLEIGAALLGRYGMQNGLEMAGMYRPHDNPGMEHLVARARSRYAARMLTRDDLRGCVRFIRGGGMLWYAPDQDHKRGDRVFVPFMGVTASTITATHTLARLTGAWVIPVQQLPTDCGYRIVFHPPMEGFPGEDAKADTARVNQVIEDLVRAAPEQYLWVHRRFKTRPDGEPSVYG